LLASLRQISYNLTHKLHQLLKDLPHYFYDETFLSETPRGSVNGMVDLQRMGLSESPVHVSRRPVVRCQ